MSFFNCRMGIKYCLHLSCLVSIHLVSGNMCIQGDKQSSEWICCSFPPKPMSQTSQWKRYLPKSLVESCHTQFYDTANFALQVHVLFPVLYVRRDHNQWTITILSHCWQHLFISGILVAFNLRYFGAYITAHRFIKVALIISCDGIDFVLLRLNRSESPTLYNIFGLGSPWKVRINMDMNEWRGKETTDRNVSLGTAMLTGSSKMGST